MKRASASFLLLLAFPLHAAKIPVNGRVLDVGGKPAPNAVASLILVLPEVERGRLELEGKTGPEPASTAAADAEGFFRLEAPDAGIWRVKVEAPGFVPQQIALAPLVDEMDLPEVRLARDERLAVKVTDAQGKPVAGARVRMTNDRSPSLPFAWQPAVRLALTDASGAAALPRGADERLLVQTSAPGHLVAEQRDVRSGTATLRLGTGRPRRLQVRDVQGRPVPNVLVTLAAGSWRLGRTAESGDLEIVQAAGQPSRLYLLAGDGRALALNLPVAGEAGINAVLPAAPVVSGTVVSGQDGGPLAGALVWRQDDPGIVARAGAGGAFRLPAAAGTNGVSAAAPGFFPDEGEMTDGRTATLRLEPKLTAAGTVVDEAGRPVPGAEITAKVIFNPSLVNRPGLYRSGGLARSGASGRFRLPSLAPGVAYETRVRKSGFAPAKLELPAREAGQAAQDLRIVLRAGRTAFGLVLDGRRRPVAGARVTLQGALPTEMKARLRSARNPPEKFEGDTGEAGRFEVASLPAGTYDVTVRAPGAAPLTVPGFALPEGSGRTDLGTFVLSPGATVRGLVTSSSGQPVEGAEVRAKAAESGALPRLPSSSLAEPEPADAVTGPDGTFLLADRAPGEMLDLAVSHPLYGMETVPGVAVPTESPVRVVLKPVARVSGRVTDPDGKPVADAVVVLSELRPTSFGGGQSALFPAGTPRRTATDDKGAFEIERVAPGPIEIGAMAPRRQRASVEGLEVKAGQDLANVEIVLSPAGTVEGRVLSTDGRPVPNAQVTVAASGSGPGPVFSGPRATADGDGRYRLDGIAPGPRTLEATAEGYRRGVRDVEVTAGAPADGRSVDFELERGLEVSGRVVDGAGSPIPSADVILIAGRNLMDALRATTGGDGGFRLTGAEDGTFQLMARKDGYALDPVGQTVTIAGASVSGLEIRLSSGGAITGRISGVEVSQLARVRVWANWEGNSGRVDPDGMYRIASLEPGLFKVTAVVPGTPLHAEGEVTLEAGAAEARLDLQLGGGYALTGLVLRNGQPLAGAPVALSRFQSGEQNTRTDHQGAFRFGGLENGPYELAVSTPNGALHRESVEISGDREIRVELSTASVSGRVVDATDSSPVSGAQVTLVPAEGPPQFFPGITTDARGAFRLLEVGDGAWKVKATGEGYAPGEREVRVEGAEEQEIEIRLRPTAGLTVEALLPSGQRPSRLQVTALDASGRTVASGSYPVGEEGRARISGVPPGSWQLLVESDQSATAAVTATVPGPVLRIALPWAGRLSVNVPALAESGARAKLTLSGPGGLLRITEFGTVISDWDLYQGKALLSRVPAGSWSLTVLTPDGRSWTGTATVPPGGLAEVNLN